jgi:hypothetical protein
VPCLLPLAAAINPGDAVIVNDPAKNGNEKTPNQGGEINLTAGLPCLY